MAKEEIEKMSIRRRTLVRRAASTPFTLQRAKTNINAYTHSQIHTYKHTDIHIYQNKQVYTYIYEQRKNQRHTHIHTSQEQKKSAQRQ